MKKKIIGSILAINCILPISVIASNIEIEQGDTIVVGGSVTLNFNSNGGTDCESLILPVGSTPATYELPIPMKAGHIFKGWFTKNETQITKDNPFDAFASVVSGETATVTAKWEKQDVLTKTSSISREKIKDSDEYYEIVQITENFSDNSKIITNIKTKKIEDYIIEEQTTYTYYNADGSTTQEAFAIYNGYGEYEKATAKNDLTVTVVDVNGKPIEGFEINFKTTEEDINLKTDKDGKIVHTFKPGTYESKVVTIPKGYKLNQPVEKLGFGKMYSISYTEKYVLDIEEVKEEKNENIVVTEEKIENKQEEIINKQETNNSTSIQINQTISNNTTNVKENPDPNNKDVVPAPQTGDSNSFLFLGLIPFSLFLMKNKKEK